MADTDLAFINDPFNTPNSAVNQLIAKLNSKGVLGLGTQVSTSVLVPAQIKALATTPITVVKAPGAGIYIYPLVWTFNLLYGTTIYVTDGSTDLYFGSHAGPPVSNFQIDAMLTTAGNQFAFGTGKTASSFTDPAGYINQPIVAAAATNPTTGDSTLGVSLTYLIVPAP